MNFRLARFQIPGRDVCGEMPWELPLEVYTVDMEGGQLAYNYKHTLLMLKRPSLVLSWEDGSFYMGNVWQQ